MANGLRKLTPHGLKEWWYRQLHGMIPVAKYKPYDRGAAPHVIPRLTAKPGTGGRDAPVPPHTVRGGGDSEEVYLASGEEQVDRMIASLRETGFGFPDGGRVLEFGCSSGRLTRWLHKLPMQAQVWGCDVLADAILWAQCNLDPNYRFITTTSNPHLPFEDRSFDLIYAGSVFSHIYELADAWLQELHRVLSVDGMMYLTIHDKHEITLYEGRMRDVTIARWLRDDPEARRAADSDFAALTLGGFRSTNVFYDVDSLRERVRPNLEMRAVVPEAYFGQTAVILARAGTGG